ncbi:MAG: PTS sugar transporter subunit IIC [Elusimicrobiota bacterium]|jgi:mannose/fructose/N-acetylgalactosamine-specific phosphotransferase system component IIC
MMPPAIKAALWAGFIALDFTGCGPWMVSQPLVCGPLFGWILGHVFIGLVVGGIVQLLWMDVTPVGVGIPYDATAVTLLAVYWASSIPQSSLSQVVLALMLSVPFGFVFRGMDQLARRLNTRLVRLIERVSDERIAPALSLGILFGLVWSWARYALFYGLMFWAGERVWQFLIHWPNIVRIDSGLRMAIILLPVAGMGVTLELFLSDEPEQRWASWRPLRWTRSKSEKQ